MDYNLKKNSSDYKFPKSVYFILIYNAFQKYIHNCVYGAIALYSVDILKFDETYSVILLHSASVLTVVFALIGGVLCDSWLGLFRSTLYFGYFLLLGLLLILVSSVTTLHLPRTEIAVVALIFITLGYGGTRPCGIAFGGDQFILPQQKKQLALFFVLYCMGNNVASLSNHFITPVLRKDFMCFQELTCYPLVFLIPTILMTISIVMLLLSKRCYIIKKPEGNMALNVVKCVSHAMYHKITSKDKRLHWLDYADDKFDIKMIEDIKSALRVLKLFLPLPAFWALFTMQNSTWILQATRLDGEVKGYLIKPEQVQSINPLAVIIFIPLFHTYVYPMLDKYFFLGTPLRKITLGLVVIIVAYICSGVLELNLESSYAVTPTADTAQLRIFNTVNCDASIVIDGRKFTLEKLNMWENVSIPASGKKFLKYKVNFHECEMFSYEPKQFQGDLEVMENQATSWALIKEGLNYDFIDDVDKSTSGNPLIRSLIYIDKDFAEDKAILKLVHDDNALREISVPKKFSETNLIEVVHKTYDLYINNRLVESNVPIKQGGVYTVLGYVSNSSATVHTVTVTQPNSIHIFWFLPQQILLSISEIMTEVLMMEFAFAESPPSMKTFIQACWLFTAFFGNLMVIIISEIKPFKRRALEFFLYATLMTVGTIIFVIIAVSYKYKKYSNTTKEEEEEIDVKDEGMSR